MDPRYAAEIYKHLEKQNELLTEAKLAITNELHKLRVEEAMLIRKRNEVRTKRGEGRASGSHNRLNGHTTASLTDERVDSDREGSPTRTGDKK